MRRQDGIEAQRRIAGVARPWVRPRRVHHAGTHGVALDIPVAIQHVLPRLDQAGAKRVRPQVAHPFVAAVEVRRIRAPEVAHHQGTRLLIRRREEQVHVVGHQAVHVDRATAVRCTFTQQRHVDEPVAVLPKAVLPAVAPLAYVQRNARHDQPRMPPHAGTTAKGRGRLTGGELKILRT